MATTASDMNIRPQQGIGYHSFRRSARIEQLQADACVQAFGPYVVQCGGCHGYLRTDKRTLYQPNGWKKHAERCPQAKTMKEQWEKSHGTIVKFPAPKVSDLILDDHGSATSPSAAARVHPPASSSSALLSPSPSRSAHQYASPLLPPKSRQGHESTLARAMSPLPTKFPYTSTVSHDDEYCDMKCEVTTAHRTSPVHGTTRSNHDYAASCTTPPSLSFRRPTKFPERSVYDLPASASPKAYGGSNV